MDFYNKWKHIVRNDIENQKYILKFLNKEKESTQIFIDGHKEDFINICYLLLSIPIEKFIYCINEDSDCSTDMIFQYSNLEHAIIDVCSTLKFCESPLTFSKLGKIIINAKNDSACKKYGENHAKIAEELSMVTFEKKGAIEIKNTAFGDFSVGLSKNDRLELVKRLSLRNNFVKKIIYNAKIKGYANYMDLTSNILSVSTALRRKPNVKKIVYMILKDNDLWNSIVW